MQETERVQKVFDEINRKIPLWAWLELHRDHKVGYQQKKFTSFFCYNCTAAYYFDNCLGSNSPAIEGVDSNGEVSRRA